MKLFIQDEPRRFHHEYIYADERNRRLRELEERAKKDLGHSETGQARHLGDRVNIRPGNHLRRHRTKNTHIIYIGVKILSMLIVLATAFIAWYLFVC